MLGLDIPFWSYSEIQKHSKDPLLVPPLLTNVTFGGATVLLGKEETQGPGRISRHMPVLWQAVLWSWLYLLLINPLLIIKDEEVHPSVTTAFPFLWRDVWQVPHHCHAQGFIALRHQLSFAQLAKVPTQNSAFADEEGL